MTTLDAEQTAALYRALVEQRLEEYVGELLGEAERERDEALGRYAEREQRWHWNLIREQNTIHRAKAAERELAEARRRLAAVEAAYGFAQMRATGAHARGDGQAERQWLDLLHLLDRATLTPDADA